MIRFSIFGIPVSVDPMFWLVSFMLGGGLHALSGGGDRQFALIGALVWVVAMFISILVHELGHALTGLKLGGGRTWIQLWAFGGLAFNQGGNFTRKNKAIMIAMGPGAGFLLYLLVLAIAMLVLSPSYALQIAHYSLAQIYAPIAQIFTGNTFYSPSEAFAYFLQNPSNAMKIRIFESFFMINLFWGLVNLLPIMPLDGGQLLNTFHKSPKKVYLISTIVAVSVGLLGAFALKSLFMPLLFGYLAYNSYTAYTQANY